MTTMKPLSQFALLPTCCLVVALSLGCGNTGGTATAPPPPSLPPVPTLPGQTPPTPAAAPAGSGSSFNPLAVFSEADLAKKRQESMQRLKQLGLALINHHDATRTFPPAYVADAEGKPLYSWRVLILPFVGQQALYERFDKTKAWDAPENIAISNTAVEAFKSPADSSVAANGVSYVAVVGEDFFFTGTKPMRFPDVLDGTANTVSLIECQGIAGSWAAPVDLQAQGLRYELGSAAGQLSSPYPNGLQLLYCDGSVHFLPGDRLSTILPQILTRNQGELPEDF